MNRIDKGLNDRVTRPDFLDDFSCIGPSCSDNCCMGWDVEIDLDTYNVYQGLKDSSLVHRFQKDIKENPHCTDDDVDYAMMVLTPQKNCPFLNETKWCDIQSELGESGLSKTCHNYPRSYNRIDGVLEMSATLSCPEVARLALSSTLSSTSSASTGRGMPISTVAFSRPRPVLNQDVWQDGKLLKDHPAKYLMQLRGLAMTIIETRELPMHQRLLFLGYFHEDLMPYHVGKAVHQIPKLIEAYALKLKDTAKVQQWIQRDKYSLNPHEQLVFLDFLKPQLMAFCKTSGDFPALLSRLLKQFALPKKERKQGAVALKNLRESALKPFYKAHPFFVENYVSHFMFKYLYPFSEEGDPYAGYTLLVVRLYLIEMLLCQLASETRGELTLEQGIWVVQKLTKVLEHNRVFFTNVGDEMMHLGYDHLSFLAALVGGKGGGS